MATDAAEIGSSFSDYQGNRNLGGGNDGVIAIDTRPLENLAAYTYTANKVKYDQAQKDAEANAKRLADLTAYDLTTAIPKDREIIQKGYDDLYSYVRNNPDVLDYKSNPKGWMEYNKKKNDFENKLQSGKARSILYTVRENEITTETNVDEKNRLKKNLDSEASSTDINTPLNHTDKYNITPIDVKAPNMTTFDVTKEGQNVMALRKYTIPDMSSVTSQAQAGELGLLEFSKDPTTNEYKAQHNSGKLEPVESASNISSVILDEKYKQPQFRNEDGTMNIDAVIKDNAGNILVTGNLNAVKQYNAKMQQYKNRIKSGYFEDKFKSPISFGANGLDESNFAEIDISDGIQPRELLQMRIMGLTKGEGYNTEIIKTDDAIQQARLQETIRNNKADQYLKGKELDFNKDKWKATQVGGETQTNGAFERAKRIYGDMLKLADKNGVIDPNKLRQLNVEQLKYSGIEVPQERDAEGKIISAGGFKPLNFTNKDAEGKDIQVPHVIQLVNGEIRVMKNPKKITDKNGEIRYEGELDNAKSTNIYNVGTNILNEELKTAGSKEVSTYMGVDVVKGIVSNTSGGSTSVSGSTQQKSVDTNSLDPNGFKKEGNNYRYKDGTLFDANGNIVKQK